MPPQRPNPTQTRQLDHIELRREMKRLLPTDLLLDEEEEAELLDLSNQHARYNRLRLALLRHVLRSGPRPRMLNPGDRQALALYILGDGPRPSFALLASGDGHYGTSWLPDGDPAAPPPAPPWPEEIPGEPGRYVKATGAFAGPGDGQ